MLPKDPMVLLSYVNTRLRDDYPSLDALCEDLDLSRTELEQTLQAVGFDYDAEQNRFR
jgi:biotin operon repressor